MTIRAKDLAIDDVFVMKDISVLNGFKCKVVSVDVTRKSVRIGYLIDGWDIQPRQTGFHHDQKIELVSLK